MKTIKSIEWKAEQRALRNLESVIRKEIADRLVQLQMWIEDEEKEKSSGKSDMKWIMEKGEE